MSHPTIAIVIPNRNDASYLKRCLDSVIQQTVLPDQIVVVDDQSTDDSMAVIRDKLGHITGVTIISNAVCLGTMGALNVGLAHTDADYVLFLSSNDFVESGIVERAKTCIGNTGLPGVWSALVSVVDETDKRMHVYPTPIVALEDAYLSPVECIRLANKVGHWFAGTTLMYRRDTLTTIGGFNTTYLGLGDLIAALTIASLEGAAFSPEPLAVIRPHPGGLMSRTLSDLPALDVLLGRIWQDGKVASPALFTTAFCQLMERRLRFTAMRASNDGAWMKHLGVWHGLRYRLLSLAITLVGRARLPALLFAFLLLRPVGDIFAIIWYRFGAATILRFRQSSHV